MTSTPNQGTRVKPSLQESKFLVGLTLISPLRNFVRGFFNSPKKEKPTRKTAIRRCWRLIKSCWTPEEIKYYCAPLYRLVGKEALDTLYALYYYALNSKNLKM